VTWVLIILYTMVPALELRFSIPYGVLWAQEPWWLVLPVCIIANGLLGAPLWWVAKTGHHFVEKVPWMKRLWDRFVERGRARIEPYVQRWGTLGLAMFIAVPFPGSGVYTGVTAAYVMGLRFRQVFLASWLGVIGAGMMVMLIVFAFQSGVEWLEIFIKVPEATP